MDGETKLGNDQLEKVTGGIGDYQGVIAVIDAEKCICCGNCSQSCPVSCIVRMDDYYKVDSNHCIGCGCCKLVCPANAIA